MSSFWKVAAQKQQQTMTRKKYLAVWLWVGAIDLSQRGTAWEDALNQ